jgi:ornithine cyclodeaminase/alanine dehydrogenase-like protein (mu-crystallin family)
VTLLYLSEGTVERFAPAPGAAVSLASEALRAIAHGSAGLGHSVLRPAEGIAFGSMAGFIREPPRAGMKWVAESTAAGVTATILLNDTKTGLLTSILDATFLTGLRTAAVSGACIQALGNDGPIGFVGTGLQARSHLRVLDALGRREIRIAYRRRESVDAVVAWAREHVPAARVVPVDNVRGAVQDVPVVVTMVTYGSFAPVDPTWLRADALVLPVDLAHCVGGDVAATVDLIAADDPENYEHVRRYGGLPGYPPVHMPSGAALDTKRPPGRVLIQNLGNAAADLMLATVTRDAAIAAGAGVELER